MYVLNKQNHHHHKSDPYTNVKLVVTSQQCEC